LTNYVSTGLTFFEVFLKFLENSPSTASIENYVTHLLAEKAEANVEDEKRKGDFGDEANGSVKKVRL
jgi:hypothetical protein